jgi:hypothetical protein
MTSIRNGLVVLAVLAMACGSSSDRSRAAATVPGDVVEQTVPEVAAVRIRGTNDAGLDAFLVDVLDVEVTVDGVPVELDFTGVETMDLTNLDHAWRVALFDMPDAESTVCVHIELDTPGIFMQGETSGEVDTCGLPIEFCAPGERFQQSGHAVILLDLASSIVDVGGELILLPQLQVVH